MIKERSKLEGVNKFPTSRFNQQIPLLIVVLLLLLSTTINFVEGNDENDAIRFLGSIIPKADWNKINAHFDCLNENAKWVEGKPQIKFHPPCPEVDGHYGGTCAQPYTNEHYMWQVPSKELCDGKIVEDFNRDLFLEMIGRKNVLLIGDSMTSKFSSTIRWALNDTTDCLSCNACRGEDPDSNVLLKGSNFEFRVVTVRNDYATIRQPPEIAVHGSVHLFDWKPMIKKYDIQIVIINRGAHFVNDWDYIAQLYETFDYLTRNHPEISIFFRDTPPGHLNHHTLFNSAPLTHPQNETLLPYHWGEFRRQNGLAKSLIRERFPQVMYVDVATATSLRADKHADELHYCGYGPQNTWVLMIYNIFKTVLKR